MPTGSHARSAAMVKSLIKSAFFKAGSNLLTNGDFETGWAWDPNINYWTPWWWNTDPCTPKNIDIGDHTANYGENPI